MSEIQDTIFYIIAIVCLSIVIIKGCDNDHKEKMKSMELRCGQEKVK
jgi:hypothetical protein